MRYKYQYNILIKDLTEENKRLKIEFEKHTAMIKKHRDKFYWKAYHYINEKKINKIKAYCSEVLAANQKIIALINAYKIANQNDIDAINILWDHNCFISALKTQFKGLKAFNKFQKEHPYQDNYQDCYEKIRYRLQQLLSRPTDDQQHKTSQSRDDMPNYIKNSLNILDIYVYDVSFNIVKKYYKKAAMKNHPDVGGSIEKMQQINQAYENLKEYYQTKEAM